MTFFQGTTENEKVFAQLLGWDRVRRAGLHDEVLLSLAQIWQANYYLLYVLLESTEPCVVRTRC